MIADFPKKDFRSSNRLWNAKNNLLLYLAFYFVAGENLEL